MCAGCSGCGVRDARDLRTPRDDRVEQGDLPRALRWVAEQPFPDEAPIPFYREANEISRARVLLASEQLNRARDLLEKLSEAARRGCRKGRLVEILALYFLTLHALGAVGEARAALGEALELAKGEGYMRSLLDAGDGLEILPAALAQEAGSSQGIYARKLLAVCRGEEVKGEEALTSQPYPPGGRYEALTPREMEVLQAMADGLNNTEIARKLVVAVSTIKRHIHHIFAKLDATSRTQALVRARQLGLLK